ncbi:MAG: hypothetical protein E6G41_14705 [Actinobacteria bacterium]|nr:MAG: hypothetical protein E6G41_14705 [Actinomycetota bacterium]
MPVRGRWMLLMAALVAGFALGAGPAVGAKHSKSRLVVRKARAHGHLPALPAGRPPLVGTLSVPSTTPTTTTDPAPTTPAPTCPTALGVTEDEYHTNLSPAPQRRRGRPRPQDRRPRPRHRGRDVGDRAPR